MRILNTCSPTASHISIFDRMNTFVRRHRASWAAALSASMVFGGAVAVSAQTLTGVLPQNPRAAAIALPQKTLNQIAALEAEADARTPIQKKISSHLLYTAKMHAGQAIAVGVPVLTLGVTPSIDGKVEVDITADVTDALLEQIEAAGGTIEAPAEKPAPGKLQKKTAPSGAAKAE